MAGDAETNLVSQIVERIHAKIALGEYVPGDRLRQELLAEEFKVSRTPIREALRLLEAKGVISQTHRHSAVVRAPSAREIRETYQVRAELEQLVGGIVAHAEAQAGFHLHTRRPQRAGPARPLDGKPDLLSPTFHAVFWTALSW